MKSLPWLTGCCCCLLWSLQPVRGLPQEQQQPSGGQHAVQDLSSRLAVEFLTNWAKDLGSGNSDKDVNNVVLAPFGVAIGLGMLYEGLDGQTKRNVGSELGFPVNDRILREQFKSLVSSTSSSTAIASMITVDDTAGIKPGFAKVVRSVFGASPFRHPFSERPLRAIPNINKWVEKRTNGKIKELMPPGSVDAFTKLVLVNAIHFKSEWKEPFYRQDTEKRDFTLASGNKVSVDMMDGEITVGLWESSGGTKVVALDFADQDTSMVLVLPPEGSDLSETLQKLANTEVLEKVLDPSSLASVQASVALPKFSAEEAVPLHGFLTSTFPGLGEIFAPGGNFSRMADDSQGFSVSQIYHKAVIDVDEAGVEAVGATAVSVILKSFFVPEEEITFDRPFAFFLVNAVSQNILFAGAVTDPRKP